jgi:hypothetical protein
VQFLPRRGAQEILIRKESGSKKFLFEELAT